MESYNLTIVFLAQLGVVSLALTICSLLRDQLKGDLTFMRRVASGSLFGATAALLMHMPGELLDGFRFDLRIVPLAVVGLISGPVGAAVAATIAAAVRIWIGGEGMFLGLGGITLAFAVSVIGAKFIVSRLHRTQVVFIFSSLNAGVALLVMTLLPQAVRNQIIAEGANYLLLGLNFLGTAISTFFVRLDKLRRENGKLTELHRQIVRALPDALSVKDLNGRFLIANEATARLMGAQSAGDMVGTTDFDYYSQGEASVFYDQEKAFVADPKPVLLEQQFQRDGETVWLHTVKAPYFDDKGNLQGIVSHTSDVSRQKELQAELVSTQVLLETAMDEMADGLAMFDCEGRLVMWNRHYLGFFPYLDEDSCRGRTLAELLTAGVLRGDIKIPDDTPPLSWVEAEVHRSQTATQSDLLLSDGRWLSKSTSILADGGWVTLYSDISQKKAAVLQLERLASKDGLTELANRRIFDRRLQSDIRSAIQNNGLLSLLMVDVDHFKAYNDTYGHPAGDLVLQKIAAVLQSGCRTEMDLAARYGGEEFAIILPATSSSDAHDIASRLASGIRSLAIPHTGSTKGHVTVSVGLASLSENMTDCSQLLQRCDQALYSAKAAGRDRVRSADPEDVVGLSISNG